ncbi:MAG: HPr(Ser) kinase/phosphatase [bacterium]|jgi:HPr kinase/phosphorylase|nr:HPr(Ser) kinase/phosphatase [bacterium]
MNLQKEERILRSDPFPVRKLLDFSDLHLRVLAGEEGLNQTILLPELNRPALELSGFFEKWRPNRIQILGSGEMAYLLSKHEEPSVHEYVERIFASHPPCVVITNNFDPFPELLHLAETFHVALLQSELHTTQFTKRLWDHLEIELSPYVVKRGVMMDIFNVGVLITGPSSVGKSESALELMHKGHTFVADDLITIRGAQSSKVIATGHSPVPYHMEIRGIGIIDAARMYGPRAIRQYKQLDLIVSLEDWDADTDYERLGIDRPTTQILGIDIPCYTIPVKPGRNISTIVEVAVLDHKLRESGVFMAKEFDETLIKIMQKREGR